MHWKYVSRIETADFLHLIVIRFCFTLFISRNLWVLHTFFILAPTKDSGLPTLTVSHTVLLMFLSDLGTFVRAVPVFYKGT